MSQEWYYRHSGQTVGPLTAKQLRKRVLTGELVRETRVQRKGDGEAILAGEIKSLFEMPTRAEVCSIRDAAARIVEELIDRIPVWREQQRAMAQPRQNAPRMPRIGEYKPPTLAYGIIGKCCIRIEHLLMNVAFLMSYRVETLQPESPSCFGIGKLTLGEVCRQIKCQQGVSDVFLGIDKVAVGIVFSLLDQIVSLRNKLIHAREEGDSLKDDMELLRLLQRVEELCNSWFIKKMLVEPRHA